MPRPRPSGRTRDHAAVPLRDRDGFEVAIDVGIVDVIKHLWSAGVHTLASCEAYPDGRAHVLFGAAVDLERAVELLLAAAPDHLREFALMRTHGRDDWSVSAWSKLWLGTGAPPEHQLDGPTPLYYELALPAAHLPQLSATIT